MPLMPSPERRVLLAADMQRYSSQSNLDQYHSQQIYREIMGEAAESAGLHPDSWIVQKTGDGEVSVLPVGTSDSTLISRLVPEVDRHLRDRNQRLADHVKIRLRIAVHSGPVHHDAANGFAGEAIVTTARLVDAPPLKAVLNRFPDSLLGLIVSDLVYREVVRHRYEGIRPELFRQVSVSVKEFSETAWIHLPGQNVIDMDGASKPPATTREAPAPRRRSDSDRVRRRRAAASESAGRDSYSVQGNQFQGPVAFGPGASAVSRADRPAEDSRGA